ncbi:putative oxidoreductase [Colletotrichum shisoi]|uniref:Putative oxidoreductase n=1 Tax=Colletotrichum shisoi TaxID=2078593 RepID=A0A5Q4BC47_9PEZI|nr:putative oxidoreductase [Colletotrichum shisoi]
MPSYLVTGVNRGIGWAFLRNISDDPNNTIIGTVRDKASAEKKIADELGGRSNIHIVEVEMTSYDSIQKSVDVVSQITGGKLDYIIANAAYISDWKAFEPIGNLGDHPEELENDLLQAFKVNVVGNVHLFNLYIPLVLQSDVKKVITISSGMADMDLINQYRLYNLAPYSISKGAVNIAVSKFHAQYAADGVLFMSICPGLVETGHNSYLIQPDQLEGAKKVAAIFNEYAPGAVSQAPEDSVVNVMKVIYESSLENGRGGAYISHLGSKRWL